MQSISLQELDKAIAVLKRGGVVVFPTETAYGLAADVTSNEAVERVFSIKNQSKHQSFPMIAEDVHMVETVAGIPHGLENLAKKHWPGALTLILPTIGNSLTPGVVRNGTVAIRVSSDPVATALSRGLGAPIVSTSANRSGEPACYSIQAVQAQLDGQDVKPDFYLDAGELVSEPPSTIVAVDDYGYPEVLRQGAIEI